MRKALDDFLFFLLPNFWVPLYNSVSFTHMPYKKCIENRAWQDRTLNKAVKFGGFIAICTLTVGAVHVIRTGKFNMSFEDMLSKVKF